jgi:tRNA (uracil-5-)-methyltransferase TRM9
MTEHTRESVRATFERIGEHFAQTRANPWPEVERFCEGRSVSSALDIGCGNGRHSELLSKIARRTLALDASEVMLATARNRLGDRPDVVLLAGDATRLPLKNGTIDLAVYVATLHHLPTDGARAASLRELARVLSPTAAALVSTWSTTHEQFDDGPGFDTTIEWTLPDGTPVDRFYHVFDPGEFQDLLDESPLRVRRTWTSSGNCYAVVRGSTTSTGRS